MKKIVKKEKMVAPKKTKITKKNEIIVDLTAAEDDVDVFAAHGFMKVKEGQPITDIELESIIENYMDAMIASMFTWNNTIMLNNDGTYSAMNLSVYKMEESKVEENIVPEKKPGFFKRFWRWLTRKK